MTKNQKIAVVIILSLIMVSLFVSIFITVEETIPDNAVVIVTGEDKLYHSIHVDFICLQGKTDLKNMTLAEAKKLGYKPHSHDVDLGYFKGNRHFLFHHLLSKLGMNINSRWDANGDWLW
jgi:hypothetical protein